MQAIFNRRLVSAVMCFVMIALMVIPMSMTAHASSTAITGRSTISQTVYTGPDSSDYVSAGSISSGETVYILGKVKNMDWYHIQYHAGTKQKAGYVPTSTITNISGGTPHEEIYNGGLRMAVRSFDVYSCDDSSISVDIGGISANETFTLLYAYQYSDSSKSYLVAYIEYSTSSGAKRGYVYYPEFIENITGTNGVTSVARMRSTATVYHGEDSSAYATIGTIGANEFVSVVCKKGDWVYVEYNTNSGRKRGYLSSGYLDYHVAGLYYKDTYGYCGISMGEDNTILTVAATVYAGPGVHYAQIDSLGANTSLYRYVDSNFDSDFTNEWSYIYYRNSAGKLVSGWINK